LRPTRNAYGFVWTAWFLQILAHRQGLAWRRPRCVLRATLIAMEAWVAQGRGIPPQAPVATEVRAAHLE